MSLAEKYVLGPPLKTVPETNNPLKTINPGFELGYWRFGLRSGGPFPYFPSNGGPLTAVAMMAAGWDGGPDTPAPGFPADGSWTG